MAAKIEVLGRREIQRNMERLSDRLRNKILGSALRDAAKLLVRDARGRVPVDSGRLKRSIGTITLPRRGAYVERPAVMVGPRRKKGSRSGQGYHGHFIEDGTKRGVKARKYMYKTYLAKIREVELDIQRAVSRAIIKFR